jgi:dihydroflavonol-4-reductase
MGIRIGFGTVLRHIGCRRQWFSHWSDAEGQLSDAPNQRSAFRITVALSLAQLALSSFACKNEIQFSRGQSMTGKLILVTGISGFIAKHCAVELLKHGYKVRGTLRSLAKADEISATLAKHAGNGNVSFVEADLSSDKGWDEAARGAHGVLHIASPFPLAQPKDDNDLIRPAVDGTLRVLKAAIANGAARFVQTSSSVAVMYGHPTERTAAFTEEDWSNLEGTGISAYAKSKTLAERAAREHIAQTKRHIHFSTINPGFVLGPLLDRDMGTSGEVIQMFLKGKYPGCPKLSFATVDVRDIAKMHRLALETSEPSGGRYLGVSETAWFIDMMRPIKARLGEKARKVPSRELPNFMIKLIGMFDPAARGIVPELGHFMKVDNSSTRKALGMEFIPVTESAPAMAQSLVDLGLA